MTTPFSFEFLVVVLFIVNVFMFFLLALLIRRINRLPLLVPAPSDDDKERLAADVRKAAAAAAADVTEMLSPLVSEAQNAAVSFDTQIREKRKLSKNLNDALDSRLISLNLLLSRAETLHKELEEQQRKIRLSPPNLHSVNPRLRPFPQENVVDQQRQIIELYLQETDIDTIAQSLSIPKGEVQLVIDLKEKFLAMEQA